MVLNVNEAPSFTSVAPTSVDEYASYLYTATADDPDAADVADRTLLLGLVKRVEEIGNQNRGDDSDDGNHDQQLDERKALAGVPPNSAGCCLSHGLASRLLSKPSLRPAHWAL